MAGIRSPAQGVGKVRPRARQAEGRGIYPADSDLLEFAETRGATYVKRLIREDMERENRGGSRPPPWGRGAFFMRRHRGAARLGSPPPPWRLAGALRENKYSGRK